MENIVNDLLAERRQLIDRLSKINKALTSLRALYPEAFEAIEKEDEQTRFNGVEMNDLPLRTKIKTMLKVQGSFTKVSDLARIALAQEPESTTETLETLQAKISRTLTAMKKIPSANIEKRKVANGATGFAWGFTYWPK